MATAAARGPASTALELRYEAMLNDPAAACRQLLMTIVAGNRAALEPPNGCSDALAEDSADLTAADVIRRCIDAASFARLSGGRDRGMEDRGSFFRKGVAGDWRRWLSLEQQAWYAASPAGALLRDLGYPEVAEDDADASTA